MCERYDPDDYRAGGRKGGEQHDRVRKCLYFWCDITFNEQVGSANRGGIFSVEVCIDREKRADDEGGEKHLVAAKNSSERLGVVTGKGWS